MKMLQIIQNVHLMLSYINVTHHYLSSNLLDQLFQNHYLNVTYSLSFLLQYFFKTQGRYHIHKHAHAYKRIHTHTHTHTHTNTHIHTHTHNHAHQLYTSDTSIHLN